MLSFNLQPIFRARQIEKPFSYLVANGFSYHAAHRIVNNIPKELRLDHVTRL